MSDKIRVQVIGNYLEPMERPLRQKGILIESIIPGCSPLAMSGNMASDDYSKYSSSINHLPTLLNIRKNLSQMLSHDPNSFCQNYLSQPSGREVRYSNKTEYIVVMNTAIGYALFEKNGVVYSDTWPQNPFVSDIKRDKSYQVVRFPFPEDFNWKYYYDKFIESITKEYDHNHIILIRVNSAQWFMDNQEIGIFDNSSSKYRNMVEKMDEYFLEKTKCLCINEQYNHIPHMKNPCTFTYAVSSPYTYKQYEKAIVDIVKNRNIDRYKISVVEGSPLVKQLKRRLSSNVLSENEEALRFLNENWITLDALCLGGFALQNTFFEDISKLKRFIDVKNSYTLSDYVIELYNEAKIDDIDLRLVSLYTEYFKLNINDVIAVYFIYSQSYDKSAFNNIISNIAKNTDCLPVESARGFLQYNIDYLSKYPYISADLKNMRQQNNIYIRLENNCYLVVDKISKTIDKISVDIKNEVDSVSVLDNGCVCPIECADALCLNLAFYIERARRDNGNTPITIIFNSDNDFYDSLNYIDYVDILENEKFIIQVQGRQNVVSEYRAICDLSFLFENPVKIFFLGNGFNDQIRFYFFAKVLQDKLGGKIYFDDIYSFVYKNDFNGSAEIEKVVDEDLNKLFISKRLSPKLLDFVCKDIGDLKLLCGILFNNGYKETVCFSNRNNYIAKLACPTVYLRMGCSGNEFDIDFINLISNMPSVYMQCFCRLYEFKEQAGLDMRDYIHFPEFTDEKNIEMQMIMLSCDAVVIHFRRGDYIEFAFKKSTVSDEDYTINNFYIEAIKRLQTIDDYRNKKYFIFSDDIPWVKNHFHDVGLDQVEDSEIYFIEHNKGSDSFKDMQLMMNGKIMIISQSGLATNAAFLSDRCEVLASMRGLALKRFCNAGKNFKYDLEPLPRGMFKNWI